MDWEVLLALHSAFPKDNILHNYSVTSKPLVPCTELIQTTPVLSAPIYVCVCNSVPFHHMHSFLKPPPQSKYRMFRHKDPLRYPFQDYIHTLTPTSGNHECVLHLYNFISRLKYKWNHIVCNHWRHPFTKHKLKEI